MTACVLVLGLLVGCPADAAARPPTAGQDSVPAAGQVRWPAPAVDGVLAGPAGVDRWIAQDKVRHFGMSFAATNFGYGGARFALEPDAALIAAGVAALALGVAKEVHDARAGRWFSLKDIVWDAAGVVLGLTLVHHIR